MLAYVWVSSLLFLSINMFILVQFSDSVCSLRGIEPPSPTICHTTPERRTPPPLRPVVVKKTPLKTPVRSYNTPYGKKCLTCEKIPFGRRSLRSSSSSVGSTPEKLSHDDHVGCPHYSSQTRSGTEYHLQNHEEDECVAETISEQQVEASSEQSGLIEQQLATSSSEQVSTFSEHTSVITEQTTSFSKQTTTYVSETVTEYVSSS